MAGKTFEFGFKINAALGSGFGSSFAFAEDKFKSLQKRIENFSDFTKNQGGKTEQGRVKLCNAGNWSPDDESWEKHSRRICRTFPGCCPV